MKEREDWVEMDESRTYASREVIAVYAVEY